MIKTRVEDHTIHISGYVSSDAYDPLKEALSQVSDRIVLSFDEKCFINSTGLAVRSGHANTPHFRLCIRTQALAYIAVCVENGQLPDRMMRT